MDKATSYGFFGKIYIYSGLIYIPIFFIITIFFLFFKLNSINFEGKLIIFFFLSFASVFSVISAWVHPKVRIEKDGLLIVRLFFVRRKIKWQNILLNKRLRAFTRSDLLGLDPRYALIIIKDATMLDKYIIILPFFKGYDEFISEIESNISKTDVFIDKNYY